MICCVQLQSSSYCFSWTYLDEKKTQDSQNLLSNWADRGIFQIHLVRLPVYCLLFIVLFAKNCTNQIKSNYLNSHGEEAQEKPPGL